MKLLGILIVFLGVALTLASKAEEYHKRYIKTLVDAMTCHGGYKSLSQRVRDASEKCSKEPEMASFMCFVTCVYRGYGLLMKDKNEFDQPLSDLVLVESFDMEDQAGRDSYWDIVVKRYYCGIDYQTDFDTYFPFKYNDAADCAKPTSYLACQANSLTCKNTTTYSFTTE